jgi:outer membrane protein
MNKILIAVTALLLAAVIFLFVKVFSMQPGAEADQATETKDTTKVENKKPEVSQAATAVTGKIAYVNIDKLNEQSLELKDLVAESKRRQGGIEASVENLQARYQAKVEEFQKSQRAGIAPESELRAKAKEIEDIEREAQNKQVQMDNLTMDVSRKNEAFQQTVRELLIRWNKGRYDYILSYSETIPSLLLGNASLEITDEVITELNAEYKNKKGKK